MKTDGLISPFLQLLRMEMNDSLIVLAIWLTYLVPFMVNGLVAAHVILLGIICVAGATVSQRPSLHACIAFIGFFAILALSAFSAVYHGLEERFLPETVKLILLFLGTFFIGLSSSPEKLRTMLAPSPWLCVFLILAVFLVVGSPFGVDGRLQIQGFISPNVLGYLVVMNMAIVWAKPSWKVWDWLVFVILGVLMLASLSRGALIAAVAVFAFHFGLGRSALLFGAMGAALAVIFADNPIIQRMLIIEDAISTGGSGRMQIWGAALQNWLEHPLAWLPGFGPASVHMRLSYISTAEAAHSMYIGALHYLGLLGLLYLLMLLAAGMLGVLRAPPSPERTLARDFLIIVIVNGLVDETYNGSQVTAISAVCFAVIVAVTSQTLRGTMRMRGPELPLWQSR